MKLFHSSLFWGLGSIFSSFTACRWLLFLLSPLFLRLLGTALLTTEPVLQHRPSPRAFDYMSHTPGHCQVQTRNTVSLPATDFGWAKWKYFFVVLHFKKHSKELWESRIMRRLCPLMFYYFKGEFKTEVEVNHLHVRYSQKYCLVCQTRAITLFTHLMDIFHDKCHAVHLKKQLYNFFTAAVLVSPSFLFIFQSQEPN